MKPLTGPTNTDKPTPGKVELSARLLWSQRRAWHGDTVKMFLRTQLVKDTTEVVLQVVNSENTEFGKVTGKKVTSGAVDNDYEISWKGKDFAGKREFTLVAKVGEKLMAEPSPVLYVDLDDPVFSA